MIEMVLAVPGDLIAEDCDKLAEIVESYLNHDAKYGSYVVKWRVIGSLNCPRDAKPFDVSKNGENWRDTSMIARGVAMGMGLLIVNQFSIVENDECLELVSRGKEIVRIQNGGTIIGPNECAVEWMEALIKRWREWQAEKAK